MNVPPTFSPDAVIAPVKAWLPPIVTSPPFAVSEVDPVTLTVCVAVVEIDPLAVMSRSPEVVTSRSWIAEALFSVTPLLA